MLPTSVASTVTAAEAEGAPVDGDGAATEGEGPAIEGEGPPIEGDEPPLLQAASTAPARTTVVRLRNFARMVVSPGLCDGMTIRAYTDTYGRGFTEQERNAGEFVLLASGVPRGLDHSTTS